MQNLVNDAPAKRNYAFIDSIRCIAMMSIVMEHSFSFDDHQYHQTGWLTILTFTTVIQFIKFGTVSFFLIAGFLIGEKFTDYTPIQYLKRRIDSTVLPWVFWSLFFLAMIMLNDVISVYKFNHGKFDDNYGQEVWRYIVMIYLYTSYWFIPNFLMCIAILLIFKRYLYSYKLGIALLLCTVAYMFNIYFEWIEPRHSTAIFGFVFFLWLGAQLNKNLDKFQKWLDGTSIWLWIGLSAVSLVAGVCEILELKSRHSVDAFNTLRPSNVIYSLCFFFVLLKIKDFKFTNFLKPRETTYGIFLIHYILVYSLLPMIFPSLRFGINDLSFAQVWCYMIARFLIVYIITLLLVMLINKTKAKWLIGR